MNHDAYEKAPLRVTGGIPSFSAPCEYIENYERISQEHIKEFRSTGRNPWIPEDLWVESEDSTLNQIRRYSKLGDKILDVGVGMGRLLSRLPEWQRYGMDISQGYLEIAKEKGIEVCRSLIEDMPYRSEFFDCIVCTDVLEHVIDPHLCSCKMLSVLRSGGCLVVRVPYREDMSQYVRPDLPYKYTHLRNFDEFTLRLLFEKILGCTFCEMAMAGVTQGRLRFPLPGVLSKRIVGKLMSLLARASPAAYRRTAAMLYVPYVMTMTFRRS